MNMRALRLKAVEIVKQWPGTGCSVLCALLILSSGCQDDGLEMVTVRGQVAFEGRDVPENCSLHFQPDGASSDTFLRPAIGKLDSDGALTVSSWKKGDGLVAGKYRVTVKYYDLKPGGNPAQDDGWLRKTHHLGELAIEPGTRGPVEVNYHVPPAE